METYLCLKVFIKFIFRRMPGPHEEICGQILKEQLHSVRGLGCSLLVFHAKGNWATSFGYWGSDGFTRVAWYDQWFAFREGEQIVYFDNLNIWRFIKESWLSLIVSPAHNFTIYRIFFQSRHNDHGLLAGGGGSQSRIVDNKICNGHGSLAKPSLIDTNHGSYFETAITDCLEVSKL